MDPEELKAEVDAYMQDYDKKIAEVRPGWGRNPAKQFVWGEERKRDLSVPWPQWKGQRETHWLAGLFYSQLLVGSQVLVWSTTPDPSTQGLQYISTNKLGPGWCAVL